jgi:hypothetical protein
MENRQEQEWIRLPFAAAGFPADESPGENGLRATLWRPARVPLAEAARQAAIFAGIAAKHHFRVGFQEILAKLATSDETTLLATKDGSSLAFASQLEPYRITVTQAFAPLLRYINGMIVDPDAGRRGICTRLLTSAGANVDIVIGHTQNRHILAAFRKSFEFVWPTDNRERLRKNFAGCLADYLESIGRPRTFHRTTGLVSSLYAGPLYEKATDHSPGMLTNGDGLVVLGFNSSEAYAKAVENIGRAGRKGDSLT